MHIARVPSIAPFTPLGFSFLICNLEMLRPGLKTFSRELMTLNSMYFKWYQACIKGKGLSQYFRNNKIQELYNLEYEFKVELPLSASRS